MKRQLLLLSGGLDSMVAAFQGVNSGNQLSCITFDYGQTTFAKERECAQNIGVKLGIKEHVFVDLPFLKEFGSITLIGGNTFLEYQNRELAYVPFRNGIFLSIATAYAEMHDIEEILLCTHKTDTICPDVSLEFMVAATEAINIGTKTEIPMIVKSPFQKMTKTEIVQTGLELDVPFEMSWSCYNSNEIACGKCTNCLDRLAAFEKARIDDRIPYEMITLQKKHRKKHEYFTLNHH